MVQCYNCAGYHESAECPRPRFNRAIQYENLRNRFATTSSKYSDFMGQASWQQKKHQQQYRDWDNVNLYRKPGQDAKQNWQDKLLARRRERDGNFNDNNEYNANKRFKHDLSKQHLKESNYKDQNRYEHRRVAQVNHQPRQQSLQQKRHYDPRIDLNMDAVNHLKSKTKQQHSNGKTQHNG